MTENHPHDLRLPELSEGAEVLWRGLPKEGSIGIRSPGACERIERIERYYECRDGVPVYLREDTNTDESQYCCARVRMLAAKPKRRLDGGRGLKSKTFRGRVSGFESSPPRVLLSGGVSRAGSPTETDVATHLGRVPLMARSGDRGNPRSAGLVHIGVLVGRTPQGWEVYSQSLS